MSIHQPTPATRLYVTRWVVSEIPESPRFLPALSDVLNDALQNAALNGMIPAKIGHLKEEPTGASFRLYARKA